MRITPEKDEELTPQQAAELLKVSDAHLMRAIQQKTIPFRQVGADYRVRLQDVLSYRDEREQRGKFLDELTDQAQDLDTGIPRGSEDPVGVA